MLEKHSIATEPAAVAVDLTDEQAIAWSKGIARGDREALSLLFAARFDWMVEQCRFMTGKDEHFALDTVQDAMVRLAKGMVPLTTAREVDCYLRAVLRSCAIDRLRSDIRRLRRELQQNPTASVPSNSDSLPDMEVMQATIRQLSAQECDTLINRVVRGIGLSTLAEMHGTTSTIMQGRVRRLLQQLRSEVKL